jgi:hypothetical protein
MPINIEKDTKSSGNLEYGFPSEPLRRDPYYLDRDFLKLFKRLSFTLPVNEVDNHTFILKVDIYSTRSLILLLGGNLTKNLLAAIYLICQNQFTFHISLKFCSSSCLVISPSFTTTIPMLSIFSNCTASRPSTTTWKKPRPGFALPQYCVVGNGVYNI